MLKKEEKLTDMDIREVSLVDFPANKKNFYLKKRREDMKTFKERLTAFLEESDKDNILKFAGLPEAQEKQFSEALDTLIEWKPEIPKPILKAAQTAVREAISGEDALDFEDKDIDVEKLGAKFSKLTKGKIQEIIDQLKELLVTEEKEPDAEEEKRKKEAMKKAEKSEDGNEESLPPTVKRELKRLRAFEAEAKKAEEKAAMKKRDEEKATAEKRLTDLEAKLASLEKRREVTKSIKGQESMDLDAERIAKSDTPLGDMLVERGVHVFGGEE